MVTYSFRIVHLDRLIGQEEIGNTRSDESVACLSIYGVAVLGIFA